MLFNCFLLALSVSMDSLGIGITYGIKNTKIDKISNLILFLISFCVTCGSIFLGHYISVLLSSTIATFLGSLFLITLGIYSVYKAIYNIRDNFDIDNSNNIDKKEAIFLGLALSVDSIFVGIGCGIIGINDLILPILIATFQLIFLNSGNLLVKKLIKKINIPEQTLSICSGIILIFVGIMRILF